MDALDGLADRLSFRGVKTAGGCGDGYGRAEPGCCRENPLLQEATGRGIEILSEIELAYRFSVLPLIADHRHQRQEHDDDPGRRDAQGERAEGPLSAAISARR